MIIMETQHFTLLSKLIACRTTADKPQEIDHCFEIIEAELKALPFTSESIMHNGHHSMIWRTQSPSLKILLNAHLDVVPASPQMFSLRQNGDTLIGRGVTDMKFGIVTFILALQQIYAETGELPAVDILITSDEEIGGRDGVAHVVRTLPEIEQNYSLVFIPDGGDDWHIIEETKGALQLRITATGAAAHGSRPWEGKSAIDALLHDMTALRSAFPESLKYTWETTLTLGQIHGGSQVNQVSEDASAELDFRFPASVHGKDLLEQIKSLCTHTTVHVLAEGAPLKISRDNPYLLQWQTLIRDKHQEELFVKETGATDGRYFAERGIPVLLSKPVGGALHTEEEWLSMNSFVEFTAIFKTFLLQQKIV
jgi:succinyl-diaminopimelate desuccinylase